MSDNTATNLQELESRATQTNRTVYWFNVPEKLAVKSGIKRLGFVELRAGEEMDCTTRAENNQVKLGFELAKASLRYADDQKLSNGDGSTDTFWGGSQPGLSKIRQLVLAAYGHIHAPDEGEAASFLGSMETTIG